MDIRITCLHDLTSMADQNRSRTKNIRTTRCSSRTRNSSHRLLLRSLSAACIGAFLIMDGAAAQSAGASQRSRTPNLSAPESPQVFSTQRRRSSGSFWTPERMRDAEPMEPPLVSPDEVGPTFMPESLRETGESRREPGAPPSTDVAPDFENYLFEPREPESQLEPEPEAGADFGTDAASFLGALFTNSRVFPREALTAHPYRVAGKLFAHDPVENQEYQCSAAVIQRRLVVTAGNCVYKPEGGYWRTNLRFVPAYDEGVGPFEAWDSEQALTTQSWTQGDGAFPNVADFAILVMTDKSINGEVRAIGEVTGWLGWQTDLVTSSHVTILGYPGNLDNGERMQQTNSQTFQLTDHPTAEFGSAHGPGASGGAFILNFGEAAEGQDEATPNVVVGIYSYYYFDTRTELPVGLIGTSIINGEFSALFDAACQATRDNCI
jgi:hypothetical protein